MLVGIIWLFLFAFGVMSGWRRAALIILTLPAAFATDLFFVTNLQSCGRWLCG